MFFHSPVCGKTQAIASLWQMWSWVGGWANIANTCAEIFANIYRPSLIPASVLIFVMGWPPSSEPLSPPNQVNNRQSLQLTNEISYQLSNITSSVNWPTQKCNQLIKCWNIDDCKMMFFWVLIFGLKRFNQSDIQDGFNILWILKINCRFKSEPVVFVCCFFSMYFLQLSKTTYDELHFCWRLILQLWILWIFYTRGHIHHTHIQSCNHRTKMLRYTFAKKCQSLKNPLL